MEKAIDFRLPLLGDEENQFTLSKEFGEYKMIHIVFLRHLSWLPWRDHISRIKSAASKYSDLKIKVIVISFEDVVHISAWKNETNCPFTILIDLKSQIYSAYGLGSIDNVWTPRVILYYTWEFIKMTKFPEAHGDIHQLGGDFIVDRWLNIIFCNRSTESTDRPSITTLLDAAYLYTKLSANWWYMKVKFKTFMASLAW